MDEGEGGGVEPVLAPRMDGTFVPKLFVVLSIRESLSRGRIEQPISM